MATKDKLITVESLSALHEHNKEAYMNKENPAGTGSLSMNRLAYSEVGINSVAEGNNTTASGEASHAEGSWTTASGSYSHAEGGSISSVGREISAMDYPDFLSDNIIVQGSTAFNIASHAEGDQTLAFGEASHAEGSQTNAFGKAAHAEGLQTIASGQTQHVQGKYNVEDVLSIYAHIVGNGTADNARSNAHTLDWKGNAWFAGNISADGNMILSSNQYGDELPDAGNAGRIFFKRLVE